MIINSRLSAPNLNGYKGNLTYARMKNFIYDRNGCVSIGGAQGSDVSGSRTACRHVHAESDAL